ncbi:MAG: hypothetical protein WC482_02200 [Candidatus Omnitrophota bacterium]
MKYKTLKLILAIWVILWISFLMREVFAKGGLRVYSALLNRSLDDKRSYVTGDNFYEFLVFCNDKLPEGAVYGWTKIDKADHARRRSTYYLYPHLEEEGADFLLVFNEPFSAGPGYELFAKLDDARYILKKKKKGN